MLTSILTFGPAPREQRFTESYHITNALYMCPRDTLEALCAEWAQLLEYLAECLQSPTPDASPSRADVSLQHLVLGAIRRMQVHLLSSF